MSDNTNLLLLGGAGVAVWWFFLRDSAPGSFTFGGHPASGTLPTSPVSEVPRSAGLPIGGPIGTPLSAGPVGTPGTLQVPAGYHVKGGYFGAGVNTPVTIGLLEARVRDATAKSESPLDFWGNPVNGLTGAQWKAYLDRELSAAGLGPAPDPGGLFDKGADPNRLLGQAQFWAVMEPALRAQGLSGFGRAW